MARPAAPTRKPASRPPTRRGAARAPLTRERIADAALELIDREGLEACSMRRLGTELGVEAMALYHHYAGKGELMDAVMERLLGEIDLPPRDTTPPLERLRRAMRSWRAVAIAHPPAYILLAGRRFNTERAFALYESLLQAFADLGLDARQTARWFRLLGGFASGSGLAEVASRERGPDATPLQLERAPEQVAYPHVRAIAPHLRVEALGDIFEFGLELLLGQLALQSAGAPQAPRRGAAGKSPHRSPPRRGGKLAA
jgi:AcrR family transcriptional regulator